MEEFFYPIFIYTTHTFFQTHTLPLWNNLFLSGTPLLPNPQSFLFYPPNIIFYFLPTSLAFIVSAFLHIFFGAMGIYFAARLALKYSKSASLFCALIYLTCPKIFGYLEAGHFGLLASFTYLPFAFLATLMLARSPKFKWVVLLAVSLSGMFYTHTIIFLLSLIAATIIFGLALTFKDFRKETIRKALFFLLGSLLTFGLIAITLLPQLEWIPQTTRYLLLQNRDVYPKWSSAVEPIRVVFFPWSLGTHGLWALDSEKWITVGWFLSLISLLGFLFLSKRLKFYIIFSMSIIFLIILNNVSPFNNFLLSQDWFALIRVSTRFSFLPTLTAIFLSGFALDKLRKRLNPKVLTLVALLVIIESLSLSWVRLFKPNVENTSMASREIYQFLKKDAELLRTFCVNRCLSQKESAKQNLELVEGYDTLLQTNYYRQAWQFTGSYWNYYTLSIPPIGLYQFKKIQPDAKSLGFYNTKYVISPYQLSDPNFELQREIDGYLIYSNKLYLPRVYFLRDDLKPQTGAEITYYSPNKIVVNTSSKMGQRLVLAQVYNKGWSAYLNGKERTLPQERPDGLTQVDLKNDTDFVEFVFLPDSFKYGLTITAATVVLILAVSLYKLRR